MERKASAVWKGGLKDGKGTISTPGGVLKDTQYSFTSVREWAGDESGGVDCGGACGVFFDGAVGAVGWSEFDSGEHQYECDFDDGEAGFGMDDYGEPSRCSGEGSGGGCGDVSKVCGGSGERVSGVEGFECEDFYDGEAGVGGLRVRLIKIFTTEDTGGAQRRGL
jgi:hypothetical protein